jgi:hypothetical protein
VSIFRRVVVADFEYEVRDGGLPVVLCLVAYILDHHLNLVSVVRIWRGEFGSRPPFPIDDDTLFVAYSAWAELTCFLVLGWRFPAHVFDLHTAYLSASNILLPHDPDEIARKKQSKKLPDACRAYGIEGWENIEKGTMANDIGEGRWQQYGRTGVLDYCEEDVKKSAELLRAMLRARNWMPIDPGRIIAWSEYSAKAVARIQARGMPIDMQLWNLVQENRLKVIDALRQRFDPSYYDDEPIYNEVGEWSGKRFAQFLIRRGIHEWPMLLSGALQLDDDAFKIMSHIPGIQELHALRDSMSVVARAKLPIGPDGRNRPSLFPFCTATGRNAHSKSLFNAHAGMRSFMLFEDGIGAYLDFRTQEIGIAAALSGDPQLIEDYRSGDVYHALALLCGLTDEPDPVIWKRNKTNADVRQRMKALQLAINYGMSVASLARGLGVHVLIAAEIIERHKRRYPQFWQWREGMRQAAMLDREIVSSYSGWRLRISTSPNERTLFNFPMQAGGADMLRDAVVRLCEAGIVPLMLVHDGILFEVKTNEEIERAKAIMRMSGKLVCEGLEIGVDTDQLIEPGQRFRDKRPVATQMWETIMRALREIGAIE